ncbi:hypothetical protein LguiB_034485 [Lonicera macranthoides]
MEAFKFNRTNNNSSRWKRRSISSHRSTLLLTISLFAFLLLFFFSYNHFSPSLLPISTNSQFPHCSTSQTLGDKYLWYAPHSGFSNQLFEFKNALLLAAVLNRTLIVPPILDHHAVVLGSCPKFRVSSPNELRFSVWNHVMELIRNRRYISIADIIDLSSVVSVSAVRVIDFRVFASIWCGVNIDFACSQDPNTQSSSSESLRKCGSLLSGYDGNVNDCLYALDEDCRTTVWTYQKDREDNSLDLFQPDEQLKKKKKISFVRRRRDIYKALGPGTKSELASVLAFGSVFTAPYKGSESYIDIREAPRDQKIQSLIEKINFLPFVPEIMRAGKEFGVDKIKAPFLCAQLRLLDGQFKNHWKTTFFGLKQKLEALKQKGSFPIHIFVMTDLPRGNWSGTYLGDLDKDSDSFKLFILREEDELVIKTAKKLVSKSFDGAEKHCGSQLLPDIVLYLEEAVCSYASLGFVGTSGSTIAENIELIRKHGMSEV